MEKKEIDVFSNFRHNIQLLRIERGISAKDLSIKLGMNERRITNFEQKHLPTVEELISISKFFNVTADDIIRKKIKLTF